MFTIVAYLPNNLKLPRMPDSVRPYAVWLVSRLYREANFCGRMPDEYVPINSSEARKLYTPKVWPRITAALAVAGILECDDRHAPGKPLGYRLARAYASTDCVAVPVASYELRKKLAAALGRRQAAPDAAPREPMTRPLSF